MKDELYVSVYRLENQLMFCSSVKYVRDIDRGVGLLSYDAELIPIDKITAIQFFKRLLDGHEKRPVRLSVFDSLGNEISPTQDPIYRFLGSMRIKHNDHISPF